MRRPCTCLFFKKKERKPVLLPNHIMALTKNSLKPSQPNNSFYLIKANCGPGTPAQSISAHVHRHTQTIT